MELLDRIYSSNLNTELGGNKPFNIEALMRFDDELIFGVAVERVRKEARERITDREMLEVFPEATRHLAEKKETLTAQVRPLTNKIKSLYGELYRKKLTGFDDWFGRELIEEFYGKELKEKQKEIKRIDWIFYKPDPNRKQRITDQMIQNAKHYPFENLVGLNKKVGWVRCPFHKEKRPSFYVKNNFGYCFGCSKGYDTIQFLVESRGLTFAEAVEALQ